MKYPNRDELIAKAKELREGGLSYQKTADRLGVGCAGTIRYWLDSEYRELQKKRNKEYGYDNREERRIKSKDYYYNNIESLREYRANYSKENKDKISAQKAIYYAENREKILKSKEIYREANRDRINAGQKVYHESHRELRLEKDRRRRAEINSTEIIDEDQYNAIWEEQKGLCFYCGKHMLRYGSHHHPDYCNVEHINPFDNGGWHQLNNVVYACRECNSSKRARLVEDWAPSILPKIAANPRLRYDIEEAHMRWLV